MSKRVPVLFCNYVLEFAFYFRCPILKANVNSNICAAAWAYRDTVLIACPDTMASMET